MDYARLVKLVDRLIDRCGGGLLGGALTCLAQGDCLTASQVVCLTEFVQDGDNGLTETETEQIGQGMEACGQEESEDGR